jgi:hypothetical protein
METVYGAMVDDLGVQGPQRYCISTELMGRT